MSEEFPAAAAASSAIPRPTGSDLQESSDFRPVITVTMPDGSPFSFPAENDSIPTSPGEVNYNAYRDYRVHSGDFLPRFTDLNPAMKGAFAAGAIAVTEWMKDPSRFTRSEAL